MPFLNVLNHGRRDGSYAPRHVAPSSSHSVSNNQFYVGNNLHRETRAFSRWNTGRGPTVSPPDPREPKNGNRTLKKLLGKQSLLHRDIKCNNLETLGNSLMSPLL
ncbi:hypothetical protein LAZ67_5000200 [Cordylochernes scorpioides]|uniref:Uncharacterized protein n=1 Tax=Cordylochernes scorpioides TaxID=51811 RepID=A0ABY6KI83_9ARAC|nr:hypothetical protein LAZ67_5000200 [Cordylochernes scorpioides]